jgi:hypothetical protein
MGASSARLDRVHRGIVGVAVGGTLALAALHLWTLAILFGRRIAFPIDLEWVEGGHIYQAWRWAHGLPIYVDPASGFVPYPYPPLFWLVLTAAGHALGLDYATGRAVSIAATVGIVAILGGRLIRHSSERSYSSATGTSKEARSAGRFTGVAFAVTAAASVGAGYPLAGGSFDLARPDAFATFLAVAAAALAGNGVISRWRALAVAFLLVAAVFAKQTGVFFAVGVVGFVFSRDRRTGLVIGGSAALVALVLFAAGNAITAGWFATWIFEMGRHPLRLGSAADPLLEVLHQAPFLPVVVAAAGFARRRGRLSPESAKWLGLLAAAIASLLVAHVKEGGWRNLYVSVFALAWPASLFLATDLLQAAFEADEARRRYATGAIFAVLGAVLLWLRYDPSRYIPAPERVRSARQLDALVAELEGEVVVTSFPFVAVRAGKSCPQPSVQAYGDIRMAGIQASFTDALDASGARWVVTTGLPQEEPLERELSRSFERVRELDLELYPHGVAQAPVLWRRASSLSFPSQGP